MTCPVVDDQCDPEPEPEQQQEAPKPGRGRSPNPYRAFGYEHCNNPIWRERAELLVLLLKSHGPLDIYRLMVATSVELKWSDAMTRNTLAYGEGNYYVFVDKRWFVRAQTKLATQPPASSASRTPPAPL